MGSSEYSGTLDRVSETISLRLELSVEDLRLIFRMVYTSIFYFQWCYSMSIFTNGFDIRTFRISHSLCRRVLILCVTFIDTDDLLYCSSRYGNSYFCLCCFIA